ncbi:MAG: 2-keto-4-pentenoate hydratase [Phenylobacterium sp.]
MSASATAAAYADAPEVARRFVAARRAASALPGFPGDLPPNLAASYDCQEAAIRLWPDEVAGWKVGRIPDDDQKPLGAERLRGPVFHRAVWQAGDAPTVFPVFIGGFAAVEAEYVYRLGEDAPPGRTEWTPADALTLAETLLIGVETAGSPLAAINILGPRAVVADFGNNAGLILGGEIPDWRIRANESLVCEAFVEGVSVGRGGAASLAGGPAASLAFVLGHCAAAGRPLRRGMLVTTGAATGIHDIEAGQTARITFEGIGEIQCVARPARADEGSGGDHGQRDTG